MTDGQLAILKRLADVLEAGRAENGIAADNAAIYASAIRAALASSDAQGGGWQLVPTLHNGRAGLTDAMMRAFYEAFEDNSSRGSFERLNAAYNAMLHAAPQAECAPQWISVDDRLPECRIECTSSGTDVSSTVYLLGDSIGGSPGYGIGHLQSDGKWVCYDGEHDFMCITCVTHWMPLPAAPLRAIEQAAKEQL